MVARYQVIRPLSNAVVQADGEFVKYTDYHKLEKLLAAHKGVSKGKDLVISQFLTPAMMGKIAMEALMIPPCVFDKERNIIVGIEEHVDAIRRCHKECELDEHGRTKE